MPLDLSAYPRLSLAERERRWSRVRALMRERGCDCLVTPGLPEPGAQVGSRYLSQIGGLGAPSGGMSAWVVFPLAGETTAICDNDRRKEFFVKAWDWVTDVRLGNPTEQVPARLRELGLDRGGKIGIIQWNGAYRAPDGDIPHGTIEALLAALPQAHLYPENEVLDDARFVKSPEELALLEASTAVNEEAIRVMCAVARPGVPQESVWLAMADAMMRATRALPGRLSITAAGPANGTSGMPIPDPIPAGALFSQEIMAPVQGYHTQCNHTIQVGPGGPVDYPDAMRAAIAIYQDMVAWVRPGLTVRDVCAQTVEFAKAYGVGESGGVSFFSNGLGDDFPRVGGRGMTQREGDALLQPGVTFTFKPSARLASGTSAQFGDPITITETGARRLGQRPMEPIIVGE